jgi:hypothetical protein
VRRVRWFEATWPFSMRTLASHLKGYTFLPESDDGFILHRARDRAIEGAYFERLSLDEVVRDPFGNETTFQHIVYRDVEFLFSSDYPHVELRKFPRTIHAFLSRVSEVAEFRVAFVPLRIDVFDWAKGVQRAYPQRFRLNMAQLSDLFLEDTVSARVVISGSDDIRAACQRFTGSRRHIVDRIQVRFEHDGRAFAVQLSSDATMRSADEMPAAMLQDLRAALPGSAPAT